MGGPAARFFVSCLSNAGHRQGPSRRVPGPVCPKKVLPMFSKQSLSRSFQCALLLIVASSLLSAPLAAQKRSLEAGDRWAMGWVGNPQISPEGDWTSYTVSRNDQEDDESRSRIWMIPTAGGAPIAMTAEQHSSWHPRWSPDGRYLAFLSSRDDKPTQVWVLNRLGGEAYALTDTPQSVRDFVWSPDGSSLALVLQDLEPGHAEALAAGEEWESKTRPWVIDRIHFKQDYVGYLDRRRTHIYRFDLKDRQLRQLTTGDFDDSAPAWSPDGTQLVFVSQRADKEPDLSENTDLFIVPATPPETGFTEPTRITSNPGSDFAPAWSPDGQSLVYNTTLNPETLYYETQHMAVHHLPTGESRVLSLGIDRWIYNPSFSHDGASLLFMLETSGEQQLARMPLQGGDAEILVQGRNVVQAFDSGPGGELVARIGRPQSPPELFRLDTVALEPLTEVNKALLEGLTLGEVREITVTSPDGTAIESFVILPPGFSEKDAHAAILNVHGGPQMQYDWSFDFESQLLAAQGYVMILPNPRGSTGYGYDFCLAIWQDWGGIDYVDVMAAVDGVVDLGWADPERLGVMGWSYGGMMTNHVITKTDRFKAAATGASATLYVANYGHDQYVAWWEQEMGSPWTAEGRAMFERLSPFNRLDQVTTPTLVVGGQNDWNVPILNSEQLYLVLKLRGIDTQLIVYPDEFHGIDTPSMEQDLFGRYIDWFGKYLGEE